MPDSLLYIFAYAVISIIVGVVTTKYVYKHAITTNKDPIPKKSFSTRKRSIEELDALETKRRNKLAVESMTSGFWVGLFWIVTIPIVIILLAYGLIFKLFHTISIKPMDKEFVSDKQFRKAQAIIARYEQENKDQFNREFGEYNG